MIRADLSTVLNYIDRNNASAARLQGFEKDLGLTGQQFPTLLSILYVGYILFQVPSNMIMVRSSSDDLALLMIFRIESEGPVCTFRQRCSWWANTDTRNCSADTGSGA